MFQCCRLFHFEVPSTREGFNNMEPPESFSLCKCNEAGGADQIITRKLNLHYLTFIHSNI